MEKIAVIPSRYASKRLEAKALAMIGDKSLIQRVYEAVKSTELFDKILVATDHPIIFDEVIRFGGNVMMTSEDHQCGTDRIAEVCKHIDCDIVVNVQGDEPFICKEPLEGLLHAFTDESVKVASLMCPMNKPEDIENPNKVKVIVNKFSDAIYFSRSTIPYQRNIIDGFRYFKHIGVYAFKKEALLEYVASPHTLYEQTESLEQLRFIHNAIPIRMVETDYEGIGIDTLDDLEKARKFAKDSDANLCPSYQEDSI
ncbi:MAG: 3-deoxy-manno-octulosonate cytidylyltransferase [Candidatus Cloacimonadales bacterium]|jgi:3-deoxy-manno-octulosonate cytidylyltransferase (CMP-KDO synthetase)|nr:3-deoxy-manno-octulosonate cytidylyltransferase [Candidatus Cloacimonadota bacterium]MDD2649650.1 3-deoxy-manno-octulosonate cytidylyltransferase [Candidatus Cloacimonadota bacterium]MDX9977474.1 3-deoxy-manno-octulosonate cytidylyltransferase [Candidatus Cloacimonadales bacterium]